MKLYKITALITCVSVMVGVTGCFTTSQDKLIRDVVMKSEDKIAISYTLWGGKARTEYTQKTIEKFEALYPDIHVNLKINDYTGYEEAMEKSFANGQCEDVMQVNYSWVKKHSPDGRGFYDMNQLKDEIDFSQFTSFQIAYGTIDDKLNALPVSVSTYVPVFNKVLFDEYNITVPESIEDLESSSRVMKKDGVYPLMMDKYQIVAMLFSYNEQKSGSHCFDESDNILVGRYDYDRMLTFYKRLLDYNILCPVDEAYEDMLKEGLVAGVMADVNNVDEYESIINEAGGEAFLGPILVSEDAKLSGGYIKSDIMLAISSTTNHPREAALFVNYLLNSEENAEIQLLDKGFPTSKSSEMTLMTLDELNSMGYRAKIMMDLKSNEMCASPVHFENEEYVDKFMNCINRYGTGSVSLDKASAELEGLWEKY